MQGVLADNAGGEQSSGPLSHPGCAAATLQKPNHQQIPRLDWHGPPSLYDEVEAAIARFDANHPNLMAKERKSANKAKIA